MIKYAGIGIFTLGLVAFAIRGAFAFVIAPIAAAPEPAVLLLLGVGLVTVGALARKKLPLA
ncbi:MAG TPA: PEP-CTERM sorting domain-containing protein [Candidatus Acidoferrales bacterium]|nr:PEP-CTERM sorting domain-containing protein [Candidatus Acidoferrales bacterium]